MRRSAESEASSISNSPGALSGLGTSPCVEMEYRCSQPVRSQGNTMRSPAPQNNCESAPMAWNTLPGPSEACQSSRPLPDSASAMRMDQGGEALRRGPKESAAAGMRMNATCLLSGDQTGSGVAIDARIEVAEGLGGDVVHGNERVIAARGDISEFGAIGRPAKFTGLAL